MVLRRRASRIALLALSLASPAVHADDAATSAQSPPRARGKAHKQEEIDVNAPKGYDERRESTPAKIVVTHEEIDRFGDPTLGDVLKRLPGVTVTAGGGIALRGLGSGYTQVLLDGQPVPPGFTLESLSPGMIERIEIYRAPTAEFSAQAIAGTINIVLRKAVSHATHAAKLNYGVTNGRSNVNVDAQVGDRAGPLAYTVTGNVGHNEYRDRSFVELVGADASGAPDLVQLTPQTANGRFDWVSVAPRLDWTFDPGHTLGSDSFLRNSRWEGRFHEAVETPLGEPPTFPRSDLFIHDHTTLAKTSLAWARPFAEGAKLETRLTLAYNRRHGEVRWEAYDESGVRILDRGVHSLASDDNVTSTGKYTAPFMPAHAISVGWDGQFSRRAEERVQNDITFTGLPATDIDETYDARVRRLALYAQDEWEFAPRASTYLGLRWEGLDTRDVGNAVSEVRNRSSVFSPIVQGLWKLPGKGKDQVRVALARTYRAPTTLELIPRRYIANNNSATSPDAQGNPDLRPEIAWGLDAAYEHYFAGGGSFSASAYARRIDDVMVHELFLANGIWISRPANGGRAATHGIEADAKLPLRSFFPKAPAIEAHFNFARNWSSVDSVPGPNNRLAQQVPLTANAGLDWQLDGPPLRLGGNFTFQSGGFVRISQTQSSYTSVRRVLDLYALWKFTPKVQLRVTAANLLAQDAVAIASYFDPGGRLDQATTAGAYRSVRALLEVGF